MADDIYSERFAQKELAGDRRRAMRKAKRERIERLILKAQQREELARAMKEGIDLRYESKGRPVITEDAHIALFNDEDDSGLRTPYEGCVEHIAGLFGFSDRVDAEYAVTALGGLYSLISLAYSMHINNSVNFRNAVDMVGEQKFTQKDIEAYLKACRLSESTRIRIGDAIEISALMGNEQEELPKSGLTLREMALSRIPPGAMPREISVSQLESREESIEVREKLYGHDGTDDHRLIDPDN